MSVLETSRLRLRPFTVADAVDHARIYAKPAVTRFLAGGPFLGVAAAQRSRAALDLFIGHWVEHGFGVWAVVDKRTHVLIGQCGLQYLPDRPEVEILYALDTPYWGQGLAGEAAEAALRHGFEMAHLERIVAVARPEHGASRRVMAKLGMAYDGLVEIYGIRAVLYAVSREEFRRRTTSASSAGGNA
ncbi:MAG: GNAT family N-acetyltransferase [Candidatus Rokuibacteriota bacterium]